MSYASKERYSQFDWKAIFATVSASDSEKTIAPEARFDFERALANELEKRLKTTFPQASNVAVCIGTPAEISCGMTEVNTWFDREYIGIVKSVYEAKFK